MTDERPAYLAGQQSAVTSPVAAGRLALRRTWTVLRGGTLLRQDRTASALAVAVCRWHHAHNGQPIPCVHAEKEAAALTSLLDHAGFVVASKEACV